MLEVYLIDPGIPFKLASGKMVRTPIKFIIENHEKDLYEALISVTPIRHYTIEPTDKVKPDRPKKLVGGRRGERQKQNINLQTKMMG